MPNITIYCLFDQRDNSYLYVGSTKRTPFEVIQDHIELAFHSHESKLNEYLFGMLESSGNRLGIIELEVLDNIDSQSEDLQEAKKGSTKKKVGVQADIVAKKLRFYKNLLEEKAREKKLVWRNLNG